MQGYNAKSRVSLGGMSEERLLIVCLCQSLFPFSKGCLKSRGSCSCSTIAQTHTCSALFFFREVGNSNYFYFMTYSRFGGLCLGCGCDEGFLASSGLEPWEEAAAELKETTARLHKCSFHRVQLRACRKGGMH